MRRDTKPDSEKASEMPSASDSRTTSFMDALRARVTAGDEKQQKKWAKSIKPVVQKPLAPARPEWLNAPKTPLTAAKPKHTSMSRPFGSPKRKPAEKKADDTL